MNFQGRDKEAGHYQRVQAFHDSDAEDYRSVRYGVENVTQLGYHTRRQLVIEMLKGAEGDILDLGCGPGPLFSDIGIPGKRLYATDISLQMLRKAKEELKKSGRSPLLCVSNLVEAGLKDSCFDFIVCVGVLGYIPDLERGLTEINRMLRVGGTAILQVSNKCSLRERLYERTIPAIRRRLGLGSGRGLGIDFPLFAYDKSEFDERARRCGLNVVEWCYFDFQIPFMERFSMKASMGISRSMQRFGHRTVGKYLAGGYLVKVRKGQM